jgi:3-phenylpropionate/trans-cinnamate dioxygenase ferredoxin reductase subunit
MAAGVVIAGAGQAGFQAAMSLRTEGYEGPVTLIGEEPYLPYQRPPLSKGYMAGKQEIDATALRPGAFYKDHLIDLIAGETIVEIDGAARSIRLASGSGIPFESLILATGARNRRLPVEGAELDGVCYLRTRDEAVKIRERLNSASEIVVIGGGFIGLELAAAARALGCTSVTVLEAQPRLMPRVVAPVISDFYRKVHTEHGVRVLLGAMVTAIRGEDKVREVVLADGTSYSADLVLVGIGVLPNSELGASLGIAGANGFVVNEFLETAVERVYAIGDCAEHPNRFAANRSVGELSAGDRVRIESVQNAVDQARCVAAAIVGKRARYDAVPWFWTDQFDLKLQMAGLSGGCDQAIVRGDVESHKFSVFYFKQGRLGAVDSINRPAEHMMARKLIASGTVLTPDQAADLRLDLKAPELAAGTT